MSLTQFRHGSSTFSGRLRAASENADLGPVELARVLGSSDRTIRRWLDGETVPRQADRERALEVVVVLEELARVFKPEGAANWLFAPNQAFDFAKPVDLLAVGDYREVVGVIEALGEGVFV
jgi:uncharacterized protein (DUF2384 family)